MFSFSSVPTTGPFRRLKTMSQLAWNSWGHFLFRLTFVDSGPILVHAGIYFRVVCARTTAVRQQSSYLVPDGAFAVVIEPTECSESDRTLRVIQEDMQTPHKLLGHRSIINDKYLRGSLFCRMVANPSCRMFHSTSATQTPKTLADWESAKLPWTVINKKTGKIVAVVSNRNFCRLITDQMISYDSVLPQN